MNPQLAKTILGIAPDESDLSVIRDALDDKVFELATYFLNRAFLPRLAGVRIKRLNELMAAEEALTNEKINGTSTQDKIITFSESTSDLKKLITAYNQVESRIKQTLSRADSPAEVIKAYENWIRVFKTYAIRFAEIYPGNPFAKAADPDVKISSQVNMMEILEELHGNSVEKPLLHREFSRLKKLSD